MFGTAAVGVVFALVVVRAAVTLRRQAPVTVPGLAGTGQGTTGLVGEVRRDLVPAGSIFVAGEEWSARTAGGELVPRGRFVRVVGQDGLTLIVEPLVAGSGPGVDLRQFHDRHDLSVTVAGSMGASPQQ